MSSNPTPQVETKPTPNLPNTDKSMPPTPIATKGDAKPVDTKSYDKKSDGKSFDSKSTSTKVVAGDIKNDMPIACSDDVSFATARCTSTVRAHRQ